jgi:mannose-1-phosphate guanylyltransferase
MQALILAGGKGTRLRPLTVYTPKPMVPVANRPLLLYQIDTLKAAGVTDITLSLSYQPDKIENVLGNGLDQGVSLRYITEPNPLGTGGAYKYALDSSRETTIVFNGDIITNLDVSKLIDFHRAKGAAATLALVTVQDPSRYGLAVLDDESRIQTFIEKPTPAQAATSGNLINAGVYILEPEILTLIAKDASRSFEYDVFPEILEKGMPFFGYVMADYWLDIGTPANYLKANQDLIVGAVEGFELERVSESEVATRAEIDRHSVLAEGCTIKSGARILNSVIGAGVHIEEKAVVENSVIWSNTRVATLAEIRGSVVGRSCHIGRNAVVSENSFLGDKTSLTDYTQV